MKTCYIVGAGDFSAPFSPKEEDLVIAADGGYDSLRNYGIRCDLLIGDMDSITSLPHGTETVRYKKEKDETDMHLAYLEGKKRGYKVFCIYGGSGGRVDHTFANYCLLSYIREQGDYATLYGRNYEAFSLKNEERKITGKEGGVISIFAVGAEARGVCIRGLKYEVENATLSPHFPLGVSNFFVNKSATVKVLDGTLLIIQQTHT